MTHWRQVVITNLILFLEVINNLFASPYRSVNLLLSCTEKIRQLFKKIKFSDSGSNDRRAEEHTFMMFIQLP